MLKEIIDRFKAGEDDRDLDAEGRRAYTRMPEDFATILIDGSEYEVRDWSRGGVYFKGVTNRLKIDDHVNFTLKFALPHEDVLFTHSGHIIRKNLDGFAILFDLHTAQSKHALQRIMDGVLARGFSNSSLASFE